MKKVMLLIMFMVISVVVINPVIAKSTASSEYIFNRAPLAEKEYTQLNLGAIKPDGWLKLQLETMAKGMTGHLDELYPEVVGERNGWLGGDGDGWERGPYWIDGLLPLAHILEDEELLAKVKPWVEWTLNNQAEDGYMGPIPFETPQSHEPGLQKDRRRDWWPKMVMLKILMQHYSATGDERVIECFRKYFKYQMKQLPKDNLGKWSFWANRRGGDNLLAVLWLYNITGEEWLLELGQLIHEQTLQYTDIFLEGVMVPLERNSEGNSGRPSFHCVNLAQGIKEPIVYYQIDPAEKHLKAIEKAFSDIERFHGQPHGLYGGDEGMHGRRLTRGSELCSCVEMMYSLEKMFEVTANTEFADKLEMLAYNILPSQVSDDYMKRQYFSQSNQISITKADRDFFDGGGERNVMGLLEGFPCCTCNLHQGWPKFVQHMWMASKDNGLLAVAYGPSTVTAKVANGQEVTIREVTDYPFKETVNFKVTTDKVVKFPFDLRIPNWCNGATIKINGNSQDLDLKSGKIVTLNRRWKNGDTVELTLPMQLKTKRWIQNSASVELGPLVFALKLNENWVEKGSFREVTTTDEWNIALIENDLREGFKNFEVIRNDDITMTPWKLETAPVVIKAKGTQHPHWHKLGVQAGPVPWSPKGIGSQKSEHEIELIPYGCSTLRISGFPTVWR